MSKQKLIEHFFNTFLKVKRLADQSLTLSFEDKVATILQIQALTYLKEYPHSTVGELSNYLNTSSSSTAQLTERLYSGNFIARENDKADHRITHLSLTKIGEDQLKKLQILMRQKVTKALTQMPEEDLKQVVRIFENLLKALEKNG